MSELIVERKADALRVRARHDGGDVTVTLEGSAETPAVEVLGKTLGEVHEAAIAAGSASVTVDLRELEFMSSSCFKTFVTWLSNVADLDGERRYRIRFVSATDMHWQRRSLGALVAFAQGSATIE